MRLPPITHSVVTTLYTLVPKTCSLHRGREVEIKNFRWSWTIFSRHLATTHASLSSLHLTWNQASVSGSLRPGATVCPQLRLPRDTWPSIGTKWTQSITRSRSWTQSRSNRAVPLRPLKRRLGNLVLILDRGSMGSLINPLWRSWSRAISWRISSSAWSSKWQPWKRTLLLPIETSSVCSEIIKITQPHS